MRVIQSLRHLSLVNLLLQLYYAILSNLNVAINYWILLLRHIFMNSPTQYTMQIHHAAYNHYNQPNQETTNHNAKSNKYTQEQLTLQQFLTCGVWFQSSPNMYLLYIYICTPNNTTTTISTSRNTTKQSNGNLSLLFRHPNLGIYSRSDVTFILNFKLHSLHSASLMRWLYSSSSYAFKHSSCTNLSWRLHLHGRIIGGSIS